MTWFLAAALGASSLAVSVQAVPSIPIAPPVPGQRVLLAWMPGEVRCGGQAVAATPMRRPLTSLIWSSGTPPRPLTYAFAIDATGRAVSIRREGTDYIPFGEDIAPSLAATRFVAGGAHEDCRVTYAPRQSILTEAPVEDLASYTMNASSGPLPKAGWDRIGGAATCLTMPRPQPLVRVLPDFDTIAATAGVRDWTMTGYDLDAKGHPVNVRTLYGTRNVALDRAGVTAMKASRFTGGARTGCVYPFWRAPTSLAAPPIPDGIADPPADATCPARREWATQPVLRFPEAYRRRSIEGWAVVRYDIAPWGETGNIRVVAAQPSEDFGKQAIQVVRGAKLAPGSQGATGCVDRVQFVMGPVGMVDPGEGPPPPF